MHMIGIQEVVDFVVAHKIELEKLSQALQEEKAAHERTRDELARALGNAAPADKPKLERAK
jgi:hypothetical protein